VRSRTVLVWVETAVAAASACLFLLTLVWRQWIEAVFGVEPDGGDGSLEFAIPVVLLSLTIIVSLLARRDWRARRRIAHGLSGR
jgi:hypothetical protein